MSNAAHARQFKILAIVDDVTSCECCGKSDLARTVAIENAENGEIKYFGTTCALKPAKGFGFEKKEMSKAIGSYNHALQKLHFAANRIYRERGGERHQVMVYDKKHGRSFPESHVSDRELYQSILKGLGPITIA